MSTFSYRSARIGALKVEIRALEEDLEAKISVLKHYTTNLQDLEKMTGWMISSPQKSVKRSIAETQETIKTLRVRTETLKEDIGIRMSEVRGLEMGGANKNIIAEQADGKRLLTSDGQTLGGGISGREQAVAAGRSVHPLTRVIVDAERSQRG